MTCPFCAYEFREAEGEKACRSCSLVGGCQRVKCPRCGYEVPKEPGSLKALRRWLSRRRT
ncbi:MAG: hypothetical protein ACE5O2_06060 [Armatimonadota bacterium]